MKEEKKNNKVELQDNHLYINGRLLRKGEIVNIEYPKMNISARYLGYNPLRNLFEFARKAVIIKGYKNEEFILRLRPQQIESRNIFV